MIDPYSIEKGVKILAPSPGGTYGELLPEGVDKFIEIAGIDENTTVADIGACMFRASAYIALKTKAQVIAIEPVEKRVNFAKKYFSGIPNLKIIQDRCPCELEDVDVYLLHMCAFPEETQKEILDSIPKGKDVLINGTVCLSYMRKYDIKKKYVNIPTTYTTAGFYFFQKI